MPCCGGIENAAKRALQASGRFIPWQVVTISTDGKIMDKKRTNTETYGNPEPITVPLKVEKVRLSWFQDMI